MKRGKTIQELAAELQRQQDGKRDFLLSSPLLSMYPSTEDDTVQLRIGSEEAFNLNTLGHAQLSAKLGIPKKYYDHLLHSHPALLTENVNALAQREPQKMLMRTLDHTARAFLSDRYRTIDNYDLANALLPPLLQYVEQGDVIVDSSEVTESRLYIKILFPKVHGEIKLNDPVQAGLVISNSEVGAGSLRVERLLFILRCLNGMVLPASLRKYHVGRKQEFAELENAVEVFSDRTKQLDDMALFSKVTDVVTAAFNQKEFEQQIATFRDTTERKIEAEPLQFMEVTAKHFGLSQPEKTSAIAHLLRYGDLSQYGLMNAVTSTAQEEFVEYDRSIELERVGAQILDLDPTQWESLAAV